MKYTCEITIDLPRDRVLELFDDPENLKHWQTGLQSFEPVSGTPGQPGAKSRLVYRMGDRDVVMIETITRRNLPETFDGTYEAKNVHYTVRNRFTKKGRQTIWTLESEYKFRGLMRIVALLMGGAFRKQTEKFMRQFKEFAESRPEVDS